MGHIKCTVQECHYNRKLGCDAPVVHIDHNTLNRSIHPEEVYETQCESFIPRK
ncbi:MAG: DUF1540 domain-containing protein [Desulfitobacteriia bacterium]|jgi:hypothetical protein